MIEEIEQHKDLSIAARLKNKIRREYKHKINKGLQTSFLYLQSLHSWRQYESTFQGVKRLCFFIGYPRSGHSLIGSLIDAHPEAIISHELDAVKLLESGFSSQQVYFSMLENSRKFMLNGRHWTGYSYEVKHQHQGTFRELKVIGDKCGNQTTLGLSKQSRPIAFMKSMFPNKDIKFLHVIRNPFDNISTMKLRGPQKTSLDDHIQVYFELCEMNLDLMKEIEEENILLVEHEKLVESPEEELGKICDFLGLTSDTRYLSDCSSIVFKSPRKTSSKVYWSPKQVEFVLERIKAFGFLKHYSF